MKRLLALLAALALLAGAVGLAEDYRIANENGKRFGQLLVELLNAYEKPSPGDGEEVAETLEAIRSVSSSDYEVALSIAEHWRDVCVDPDGSYEMYAYRGEERAEELERSDLRDSAAHAFVVQGFELKNGQMRDELKGRCEAAAAAARSYPSAILVCSGGATGDNNPEQHTEAGLMKDYLVERCGIDPGRIYIDERAMNTVDNARNTMEILRAQNIETMTIVTSSYHQKRGQVLYNAVAALYEQSCGYRPRIEGNYSYLISSGNKRTPEDRTAIKQLASILGLPDDVIKGVQAAMG